jgi:hypothetical protein
MPEDGTTPAQRQQQQQQHRNIEMYTQPRKHTADTNYIVKTI